MTLEYFCRCLNIHLTIPDGVIQQVQNEPFVDSTKSDGFFRDVIIVFAPRHFTVNQKLRCLCRNREVDEWTITSCINCGMDTYATRADNANSTVVAVSSSIEQDPSAPALLSNQDNYSPIYKLLVSLPLTTASSERTDSSIAWDLAHKQLEELKEQTVQLLNAENERLLERIRNFENEQMSRFNELQSRVHKEQSILAQVLVSYHRENVGSGQWPIPPAMKDTVPTPPDISVVPSFIVSDRTYKNRSARPLGSKPTDDIMFAMDEEDETSRQQDDIRLDDDDPEANDNSHVGDDQSDNEYSDDAFSTVSADVRLYATSLPITMPRAWQPSLRSQIIDTDEVDVSPGTERAKKDDPQWIAASIQALAMSVRGNDGTEMFGARPRPRLNTLD